MIDVRQLLPILAEEINDFIKAANEEGYDREQVLDELARVAMDIEAFCWVPEGDDEMAEKE